MSCEQDAWSNGCFACRRTNFPNFCPSVSVVCRLDDWPVSPSILERENCEEEKGREFQGEAAECNGGAREEKEREQLAGRSKSERLSNRQSPTEASKDFQYYHSADPFQHNRVKTNHEVSREQACARKNCSPVIFCLPFRFLLRAIGGSPDPCHSRATHSARHDKVSNAIHTVRHGAQHSGGSSANDALCVAHEPPTSAAASRLLSHFAARMLHHFSLRSPAACMCTLLISYRLLGCDSLVCLSRIACTRLANLLRTPFLGV